MQGSLDWTITHNGFQAAKAQAKAAIARAMVGQQHNVQAAVTRVTPRDRGWLQSSLDVTVDEAMSTMTVKAGGQTAEGLVDYAWYVHDGTIYMRSRPYLRDGLEAVAPLVMEEIAAELVMEFRP